MFAIYGCYTSTERRLFVLGGERVELVNETIGDQGEKRKLSTIFLFRYDS